MKIKKLRDLESKRIKAFQSYLIDQSSVEEIEKIEIEINKLVSSKLNRLFLKLENFLGF